MRLFMVIFPTSVAQSEPVQLAASRTDNRRSEPTEQASCPWPAPLKARPHEIFVEPLLLDVS